MIELCSIYVRIVHLHKITKNIYWHTITTQTITTTSSTCTSIVTNLVYKDRESWQGELHSIKNTLAIIVDDDYGWFN